MGDEKDRSLKFPLKIVDEWEDLSLYSPVSYTHLDVYKRQVLGKIASEFGNSGVSLSAVKQPISTPGKLTNIYFLTHRIQERNIQNAIKSIQKLDVVKEVYAIRVEDGES